MLKDHRQQLKSIAHKFGLAEIYVFGSRAKEIMARLCGGSARGHPTNADVDIGVRPAHGKRLTIDEKVQLAIELEDFLEVERVDLVVIQEVDIFLATEVIRGELLHCSDPDEQAENELHVLRTAGDLAYYKSERIKSIFS